MTHRNWSRRLAGALATCAAIVCVQGAVPGSVAAKPVKTRLALVSLGLIDPTNGDWEYDFGVGIGGLLIHGPEATCASRREVNLFREVLDGPDTLIGTRRTDPILHVGVFRMRNPDPATVAGGYYAKAPAATRRQHGETLKCQAARSNVLHVVAPDFTP